MTTTRITHASPASGYASVADRNWEAEVPASIANHEKCKDIAYQLVTDAENQKIRVSVCLSGEADLISNVAAF